eukprot:194133_1
MGIVFGKTGVLEPSFDVILSRSSAAVPYEIRRYGIRYAIETEYQSGRNGDGFRALAGYIGVGTSPQNEGSVGIAMTAPVVTDSGAKGSGEKIAMTAPVVTSDSDSKSSEGMKKMQFILPEEYDDISKIPKPTNPKVIVKEVPAATGAVHTFSGAMNDTKEKTKVSEIANQLKEDGVDMTEEEVGQNYALWQFHPPFTLGPMRKNEIWVGLSQEQVDELLNKFKETKE